jgi:hypothetical protein
MLWTPWTVDTRVTAVIHGGMLRDDEKAIADELVEALRAGRVDPLGAYPGAAYAEGSDPPDLILQLDAQVSVGVELGRVLGGDYPEQIARARRGELRCGVWSPEPDKHIKRVFEKKSRSYKDRGIAVGWLLFHNSLLEVPGFYDMGPVGHRELRENLEGRFSTGPFYKVLLHTEWQQKTYWSVLWARDGQMIPTSCEYTEALWRERLGGDDRVVADEFRVERIGRSVFPQGGHGLVVLLEQSGELHDLAAAEGAAIRAARRLTAEVSPPYWGWFPTRTKADEKALAADLYDCHLKDKPACWHEARQNEDKPEG